LAHASPHPKPITEGATVVITHKVRGDRQADYEHWLAEISPVSRAWPGWLDWHIVRPVAGITETYTVTCALTPSST
jgi:antibiotic biosynthesis monooxygenase (ABM) superfamily enzyme